MNDFGGGSGGGPDGGFDWNGNGSRDSFDGYMDYKLSGGDDGGSGGGGNGFGGGGNGGEGCLATAGAIGILLFFLYLLGSCS